MIWNPLRTLAGRLMLVTVAAVATSHLIAFVIFDNERGAAFRREAETSATERVIVTYERMRGVAPARLNEIAEAASDFSTRFSIANEPLTNAGGGAGRRIAKAVSSELGGVETHARTRVEDVELPLRWRVMRRPIDENANGRSPEDRGPGFGPPGPPPGEHGPPPGERGPPLIVNGPPPGEHGPPRPLLPIQDGAEPSPDPHPEGDHVIRKITEVQLDAALPQGGWLRVRTLLPSPRPAPIHLWFAMFGSMLAVAIAAMLVARQIGRPLAQLAAAAERLGAGETNVETPVSGPDDLRRASSAFNTMAARLGRQLHRQKQMLWALSHDLRTPITALRLRAELIEDDAQKDRLLGPIAEMETLTEQALALARAGASEEPRIEVDLAEIARTLCAELEELGVNASAEAPEEVRANVRPNEMARAMRNLADNAAKHAGGGVMKVYRAESGEAVIEVCDDGPGVPPDVLPRLAEPFFRVDEARTANCGAGLGLAIVQAIADGHGGRLVIENRTPHGLSAKIILPG